MPYKINFKLWCEVVDIKIYIIYAGQNTRTVQNMNFTQTDANSRCTNACGFMISGKNENRSNLQKHLKIQNSTNNQECHVFDTIGTDNLLFTKQDNMK